MKKATTKTTAPRRALRGLVNIGADQRTVDKARGAILDILSHKQDASVLVAALNAFAHICAVSNTTISNCTISAG